VKRLLLCLVVCASAFAALAPPLLAAAPGISALYVDGRSGRQITVGWEGSIVHYRAASLGWDDGLMSWAKAPVNDIDVEAGRAYAAAGNRGLRILDVGDPANAREVGAWEPASGFLARSISVRGWYAYAADLHVVHVLDVSDPAAPREVSSMWLTGNSTGIDDVMVVGDRAYVAGWEASASYPFTQSYSLLVFDVADPTNPVWLGGCALAGTTTPMRLTVRGDRVYVGGSYLCIVDVADPANPRMLSWAWSGASKAGSLCAGPAVDGRYAFVASDDRLGVFNVARSTPSFAGSLVASWPESTGVAVALTEPGGRKRYGLVAYQKARGALNGYVQIVDASHPLRLDHDHGEWTGGGGNIECVTVDGDYAYEGRSGETTKNLVITHLGPTAYSWKFDRRARTIPDRRADGPQNGLSATASVRARAPGTWYFHVRARGVRGDWGPTRTVRIRVK
jgi:hypothetical protein